MNRCSVDSGGSTPGIWGFRKEDRKAIYSSEQVNVGDYTIW